MKKQLRSKGISIEKTFLGIFVQKESISKNAPQRAKNIQWFRGTKEIGLNCFDNPFDVRQNVPRAAPRVSPYGFMLVCICCIIEAAR